jgi:hypothetical protein
MILSCILVIIKHVYVCVCLKAKGKSKFAHMLNYLRHCEGVSLA